MLDLKCSLFTAAVMGLAVPVLGQGSFTNPANATGKVPVTGFRLDKPYPGDWSTDSTESIRHGWSVSLNVTNEENGTGTYTGLTLRLDPPPPGSEGALHRPPQGNETRPQWIVQQNISDTWKLVVVRFNLDELRSVEDGNDMTDGSCPESVLSEQCQDEVRRHYMDMPSDIYNVGGPPGAVASPYVENNKPCGYTEANYDDLPLNGNFTSKTTWLYSVGGPRTEESDSTYYNKYGSRTFILALFWLDGRLRQGDEPRVIEEDHITFACVKVDTVTSDKFELPVAANQTDDGGEGEGAGGQGIGGSSDSSSTSLPVIMAGVIATVAVLLVMDY